jgi:hypothetical protein
MNRYIVIAATIVWGLAIIPASIAALMSPMMFDTHGSEKILALNVCFWAVLTFPLAILISTVGMQIFHGQRQIIAASIPLINVVIVLAICALRSLRGEFW